MAWSRRKFESRGLRYKPLTADHQKVSCQDLIASSIYSVEVGYPILDIFINLYVPTPPCKKSQKHRRGVKVKQLNISFYLKPFVSLYTTEGMEKRFIYIHFFKAHVRSQSSLSDIV